MLRPGPPRVAGDVGVFGAERPLADGEGSLEQRQRNVGEAGERAGDVGVLGAERLLAQGQGALVEPPRLGVCAGSPVNAGEAAEDRGDVGVLGRPRLGVVARTSTPRARQASSRSHQQVPSGKRKPGWMNETTAQMPLRAPRKAAASRS